MNKLIFNDGVLEAILYPNQWLFVRWVQNTHGKLQKKLIKDLNLMERFILRMRLKGWFTLSETTHTQFHKLLTKFGALPREIEGDFQYFVKTILKKEDLHQPHKALVNLRGLGGGRDHKAKQRQEDENSRYGVHQYA